MSELYKTAGCILRDFQKKKGSLKSLVFGSAIDLRTKKKIFALLCKTVTRKLLSSFNSRVSVDVKCVQTELTLRKLSRLAI